MPHHACFLFIDLQRDFVEAGGKLTVGAVRGLNIVTNANRLLAAVRANGWNAAFIVNEFSLADWFFNLLRKNSAIRGSPGAEIDSRVDARGFPIFPKAAADAFSNPALQTHLCEKKITSLVLTGVMTEACVRATALSAMLRGYPVSVLSDVVASNQNWKHRLGLWHLQRKGARVMTCEDCLSAFVTSTTTSVPSLPHCT